MTKGLTHFKISVSRSFVYYRRPVNKEAENLGTYVL
ncbi:MAG: hypothetical protein FD169_2478 [Bacillota bacterium]|nr:MAG: hypothetical protein FD169_2478 [Bacillota bacterium]